jgi:hypothetical protein
MLVFVVRIVTCVVIRMEFRLQAENSIDEAFRLKAELHAHGFLLTHRLGLPAIAARLWAYHRRLV